MNRLKLYIELEKPGEVKIDKNKMHSCLTWEVDAKIEEEDSSIMASKLSSGWTVSWKRHNNYFYY